MSYAPSFEELLETAREQVATEIEALLASWAGRDLHNVGLLSTEKPNYQLVAIRLAFYHSVSAWIALEAKAIQKLNETRLPKYKKYADLYHRKAIQTARNCLLGDRLEDLYMKWPRIIIPQHTKIPRQDVVPMAPETYFGMRDRVKKEAEIPEDKKFVSKVRDSLKEKLKKLRDLNIGRKEEKKKESES